MMLCLRCRSEMQKTIFEGILIDYCPECKSCWLDKDEFENAVKGVEFNSKALVAESKAEILQKAKKKIEITGCNVCPKCLSGRVLRHEMFNIELDKCELCNGVFFDKDEFEKCYDRAKESFLAKMWRHVKSLF